MVKNRENFYVIQFSQKTHNPEIHVNTIVLLTRSKTTMLTIQHYVVPYIILIKKWIFSQCTLGKREVYATQWCNSLTEWQFCIASLYSDRFLVYVSQKCLFTLNTWMLRVPLIHRSVHSVFLFSSPVDLYLPHWTTDLVTTPPYTVHTAIGRRSFLTSGQDHEMGDSVM